MIRTDCGHLKRVSNNDIHESNRGSLRCDVNRAGPDPTLAGIKCPADCMGYRPMANNDNSSAFSAIKDAFRSLFSKT